MTLWHFLRRLTGPFLLMGVGAVIALPAFASTLNGTITVAPELGGRLESLEKERAGKLKQYYWRVPNGAVATADPRVDPAEQLVVVLESEGSAVTPPAGRPRVVHLRGSSLSPQSVAITPHTKVRFRNTDAFVHELECPDNPNMENAQPLAPGQQVDYPFDEPGVYMITDRRLPYLLGWVVVVNTPRSVSPTPGKQPNQASFSFEDVAPGSYKLKVFFAGDWIEEREVQVPEDQDEVGVQINLTAPNEPSKQSGGGQENASAKAGH